MKAEPQLWKHVLRQSARASKTEGTSITPSLQALALKALGPQQARSRSGQGELEVVCYKNNATPTPSDFCCKSLLFILMLVGDRFCK